MKAANDFVHLHLHTEHSLLDGANRIGPLCERVKALGMDAVAITDHGNLFGALTFQSTAKRAGIHPILGCELYVAPTDRHDRRPGVQRRTNHLILLAKDLAGYRNLCKLSSIGYTEGFYYRPRIDFETLERHREGLICASACLKGCVPQALLEERDADAAQLAGQHRDLFGKEDYFLELQDHGMPEQRRVNRLMVELAKRMDIGLVATNDAHYLCRENSEHQEAAICIQTGKTLQDHSRMRFYNDQFYVKSPEEMAALFGEIPDALTNTRRIAERCRAEIPTGTYHLPRFECPDGKSEAAYLRERVEEGLRRRYPNMDDAVRKRAEHELGVIHDMGFDGYFLIVWDFVKFAKDRDIPVGPGRGSAAGSIVSYALAITDIDPLEHGLFFERFLNPGRRSMPDIDIDFCYERRGEVIDYVRQRHGTRNVAQIITFGTIKAKAAIRDVGRILAVPLAEVDRLAKLVPEGPGVTLDRALRESTDLRDAVRAGEQNERLFEIARALEGTIRHASTHAAGVVIADRDLTDHLPIYQPPGTDDIATQFTMDQVEELGLLKMDFLGLKNLTIIENCVRQIEHTRGVKIDWTQIPLDDSETYALLVRGDTQGVFQLESSGMRALLQQLRPSGFNDIVAVLALYRPGPLESGMAAAYAERKHGRQKIRYDHPILESILRETHGIILYQEQVMQIARDMAGFTLADADALRKAMGKKIREVMREQEERFIDGAAANDIKRDVARRVWDQIVTFAGYGFNKSHSTAYAVISFRTAYLKAHFPTEYMAAQLTNEISGSKATEKIAHYMAVCRPMGIEILPPSVSESGAEFTVVAGGGIRFGLHAIKNVGHGAALEIIEERERGGDFQSLQDLCERVDLQRVNAKAIECLIKSGALDGTGQRRSQMMAMLPELAEIGVAMARERASGQESLFSAADMDALQPTPVEAPDIPEWDDLERLGHERELLGCYLTGHPLRSHADHLRGIEFTSTAEIPHARDGASADLLGLITTIRAITTKRGDRMAFVTIEDFDGETEALVFSDAYEKHRSLLHPDQALCIRGKVQSRNGDRRLRVEEILTPEQTLERLPRWHVITLPCPAEVDADVNAALERLDALLREHPGRWRVRLHVETPEGVADLTTPRRIEPSAALDTALEALRQELARPPAQPLTTP